MEVKIIGLDHQGRGIAKEDKKIIFIPNALKDEIIEIEYTRIEKKYIEAKVKKIIKKSNIRIESVCPYYNECGGCQLLHLSYDEQLKYKEEKVKNIFAKYFDKAIEINGIVKSPKSLNYRNKATFHCDKEIGFYAQNSNRVIKIDKCYILDNDINEVIAKLQKNDVKNVKEIIVRKGNNEIMIFPNIIDIEGKNIKKGTIFQNIGDKTFSISNDAFFQVNTALTEKLYNKVKDYIKQYNNKNVLDLYCGTGTIGLYISKYAKKIIGIEINKAAVKNANMNKELNKCQNIEFICADINEIKEINFKSDIIIVDPPRIGLERKVINKIIELNPKEIIYISCDPMTLVRDLNLLKEKYELKEVTPFDMFPNTYHVECVSLLQQRNI